MAILTIVSCKDDKVSLEENRAKMLGDWKATSLIQSNCNDSEDDINLTFEAEGACFEQEIEITPGVNQDATICIVVDFLFLDNGTLTSNFDTSVSVAGVPLGSESRSSAGTWEILDLTRMTVCLENEDGALECSTGTYTVSDTTLTYNGNDADTGCDISFTADKQ